MGALKVVVCLLGLLFALQDFPKVNGMDRSTVHSKSPWNVITYSFKIIVYRTKFLKRRMAYSAGHSGSFNPAVITNQEAHMIYGNMDRQKGHNKSESSSPKITNFFKKDTSNKSSKLSFPYHFSSLTNIICRFLNYYHSILCQWHYSKLFLQHLIVTLGSF